MTKLKKGPEIFAAIRRLHGEGKTAAEAAAALGLSIRTVEDHRRLLGMRPFGRISQDQFDAELRRLHWEGRTAAEAAAALGRCVTIVNAHRMRLGLPCFERPPRPARSSRGDDWSDADVAMLRDAIAQGGTPEAVAERTGRTIEAVQSKRRRLGLPRFAAANPPARPSWPDERVAALADLKRRRGCSFDQAARRLGVSRCAAIGAAHRYLKETA